MERTNHHDLGLGLSKVGNEGHYIYTSILTGVTHQFHSSCQQEKDLDGWEVDRSDLTKNSSHTYKHTFLYLKNVQNILMSLLRPGQRNSQMKCCHSDSRTGGIISPMEVQCWSWPGLAWCNH